MIHSFAKTNRAGLRSLMVLLVAMVCCCPWAQTYSLEDGSVAPENASNGLDIQGTPLRVWTDEFLRVWVYRQDPGIEATGFYPQYATTYRPTLRITKGGTTEVCGDHRRDAFNFTAVSIVRDPDDLAHSIIATVTSDSGNLQIVHKLTYVNGEQHVRHEWTVTNLGKATYTNVALRYGGDTQLGIFNDARGYYDAATKMLYCVNSTPNESGTMGMQAASGTDFAKFIEGFYTSVNAAMVSPSNFPSAVNVDKIAWSQSEYANNGMAVEWGYYDLAPNGTFTVTLFERWTDPGFLQVFAPPGFTSENGTQHTVTFRVQNLAAASQDVTLAMSVPEGWVESYVLAPITVPAGATADVDIEIAIPLGYTQDGVIQLSATGATTQISQVLVDIEPPIIRLPTGSDLPLSTLTRTIYTAINPCTPEGITSVLNALSGRSSLITRAFAWDSYQGRYIELPQSERTGFVTGGVQVTTGIFIATRVPLNYDLNGSPTSAPFEFVVINGADPELNPGTSSGWTFAGLPPIEVSPGNIQTAYTWPSSFEIIHNDQIISESTEPYTLMDLMGAPGSNDVSTSRPWHWNGSRYVQVDTLRSGEGYWFKNNDVSNSITIRVVDQSVRVVDQQALSGGTNRPVTIRSVAAAPSAPGAPALRDRGAPPAPPDDRANGSSSTAGSAGGGGCGSGSGISLFSMLMFLFGLRFLVARR